MNGDITQRYFDASLEYLGFRQESSPGMYWHNSDRTMWFNVLVFTTRRRLLAELVFERAQWIVEAGEKPERKYPYLLRSKQSLECSNKYYWFLHWLQPWENGSRLRRRQMMMSVTECPSKAGALKLLHQLNETKSGWEKDPYFDASSVSGLKA